MNKWVGDTSEVSYESCLLFDFLKRNSSKRIDCRSNGTGRRGRGDPLALWINIRGWYGKELTGRVK